MAVGRPYIATLKSAALDRIETANDGAPVRTVILPDSQTAFVGRDVCQRLGYIRPSDAMQAHCRGAAIYRPIVDSLGRPQEVRVLLEPDVMRLLLVAERGVVTLQPLAEVSNPVRTVTLPDGQAAFVGKDVCERIGYARPSNAMQLHCKGALITGSLQTAGGVQIELRGEGGVSKFGDTPLSKQKQALAQRSSMTHPQRQWVSHDQGCIR